MTRSNRSAQAACLGLAAVLLALASSGTGALPPPAGRAMLVRMLAGRGVQVYGTNVQDGTVLPVGPKRQGQPPTAMPANVPGLSGDDGMRCCEGTETQCITERSVYIGASANDVAVRYGPPNSAAGGVLKYPGISFRIADRRVAQICVMP